MNGKIRSCWVICEDQQKDQLFSFSDSDRRPEMSKIMCNQGLVHGGLEK